VSDHTPLERADLEALRASYRDKFENWAAEVDRLRKMGSSAEAGPVAEVRADVKLAETAYRTSRDRLASKLYETSREKDLVLGKH